MKKLTVTTSVLFASIFAYQPAAQAEWEVGFTANAFSAGGEPSNDILGQGLFVKRKLSNTSNVVGALDLVSGADFEEPARFLGIMQDQSLKAIDTKSDRTTLSVWYERSFGDDIDRGFFWKVGGSVASVDADPVSGPIDGGGMFNITTDAGTELSVLAGLGYTQPLTERLSFVGSFDVGYTSADWTVTDTVSGTTKQLGDYSTYGARLGLSYSF